MEQTVTYDKWPTYPDIRSIRDIGFDQADNLWAVRPDGVVVFKLYGTREHFTVDHDLPSNDLLSVGFDTGGNVWIGTPRDGASRYEVKHGSSKATLQIDCSISSAIFSSFSNIT